MKKIKFFKIIEFTLEIVGWLQIFISISFVGIVIGAIIHYLKKDSTGKVLAIICFLLGVIIGIFLACRAWKRGGTFRVVTRVNSSPDLDK